MSKIKYCREDFLIYYKANFETEFLPLYRNLEKEKIQNLFTEEHVLEGALDFDYQPLYVPSDFDSVIEYQKENSKLVYKMLNGLTRTQATKEELWFTMLHTYFLDYLLSFVATIKKDKVDRSISNAIFFTHGNIRSLSIQHLAKYWWIGQRTYDEEARDNPFWLTDFFYRQTQQVNLSHSFLVSLIIINSFL